MRLVFTIFLILVMLQLSGQRKSTDVYSIKGNDTLKLDVFVPENIKPTDTLPVLLWMNGFNVIAKRLAELEVGFYFNMVKEAQHEASTIPFKDLDEIFKFFNLTVTDKKIIQTKIIKNKT